MKTTPEHDARMAKMTFASVYPHYVTKVEKKGRTKEELHQVIEWLTGFDDKKLQELIDEKVTFAKFFSNANLNPNAHLITGVICGYRIEEIETPLTKQVRYLDKAIQQNKTHNRVRAGFSPALPIPSRYATGQAPILRIRMNSSVTIAVYPLSWFQQAPGHPDRELFL